MMIDYPLPTTGRGFGFEPRGRISPFFDQVDAAGGRAYRRHLNSYMAWEFGDGKEEQYNALRTAATLADVHSLHVVQIKGPDAIRFADRLVTRDVTRMTAGRCSYVFVCDEEGLILADPVMLILDPETIWMTVGTVALELWVRGVAVNAPEDVTVTAVPAPSVQVAGPKAAAILSRLTDHPVSEMRPFRCARAVLAGLEVVISTTGYSGEQSYEIYLIGAEPYPKGRDLGNRLWSAIRDAGAPDGLKESPVQYDRAREAGMITISHTEGDRINALSFWRKTMVDFSGGDFIGKAALSATREAGGPAREMVGLVATDPTAGFEIGEWDMNIHDGNRVIGTSRWTAWSRLLERAIAIALIDRADAVPGKRCVFPHAKGSDEVEITALPFVGSK